MRDPVCGMEVDVVAAREAGLLSEVDGTTVYFCCAACKSAFDEDPSRFLSPGAAR